MINSKKKGSAFERQVAKEIQRSGLDKTARRRPLSGAEKMVRGYADLITSLPFTFELKKQEKLRIWEWWEQVETEAAPERPPVLVFSSNRKPILCLMRFKDFLNLLKEKS